jgi:hypothetical protein
MKKRSLLFVWFGWLVLVVFGILYASSVYAIEPANDVTARGIEQRRRPTRTPKPAPTLKPTLTLRPTASVSPKPSPLPPTPTATHTHPTLQPTSAPTIADPNALPLCASHDPTKWHALIDTAGKCHYSHEHKDDPHDVDHVFGAPGAWFGGGQEISYPWQTFNAAGVRENDIKHNFYVWLVRSNLPCRFIANASGCVTDFRAQFHADITLGATTRFHSFSMEARVCEKSTGQCGIVRQGGWQDTGHLDLKDASGNAHHIPLPGDPENVVPGDGQRRTHYPPDVSGGYATWYGGNAQWHIATITVDDFGYVDPADPFRLNSRCPGGFGTCGANESSITADQLDWSFWSPFTHPQPLTFKRFTDRHGNLAEGCAAVGLDCVPFQAEGVVNGFYVYRDDGFVDVIEAQRGQRWPFEYDVSPGVRGGDKWWIEFNR